MSITIKDIAREAHVSVASVSRALNGTGPVTDRIRSRVLEVAARLKYVPNSVAQSLPTRRTRTIGVLLPDLQGEYFAELVHGIDIAARARGLHLLISTSHNSVDEVGQSLRAMAGRVDGLLVMAQHIDEHALQVHLQGTLPVVLISTADSNHTHHCVFVDNAASAQAMVAHLASCGHRFIAHIAGPAGNVDAQQRLKGYREALARVVPGAREYLVQGNFTEESGYLAGREILSQPRLPDAIFAANDMMAIGCLYALTEAGLQVPRDVALAGFDDIPTARFVSPPLTTIRVKIAELGSRALDRLADWIDTPENSHCAVETVPAELVVRASCGMQAAARFAATSRLFQA